MRLYGVSKSNVPLSARAVSAAAARGTVTPDPTAPATAVNPAFLRNALRFRPMICAMLPPELRRCYTSLTRFSSEFEHSYRPTVADVPVMPLLAIALTSWALFAQPDFGFVVDAPSPPKAGEKPGTYMFPVGNAMYSVIALALPESLQHAVVQGDRTALTRALESGRNAMVDNLKGVPGTFSSVDFEGLPSMAYSFSGTLDGRAFVSRARIVFVADKMFIVAALGPADELQPS